MGGRCRGRRESEHQHPLQPRVLLAPYAYRSYSWPHASLLPRSTAALGVPLGIGRAAGRAASQRPYYSYPERLNSLLGFLAYYGHRRPHGGIGWANSRLPAGDYVRGELQLGAVAYHGTQVIGVNYYCRWATTIFAGSVPPVDCVVGPRRCDSWARRIPG